MQRFTTTQELYCKQLLKEVKTHYLEGQQTNLNFKKMSSSISRIMQISFTRAIIMETH